MPTESACVRQPFLVRPGVVFVLALLLLLPVQVYRVARTDVFEDLPKPVGDGPDYENIAFHLWQGAGFRFNNSSDEWRKPYIRASEEAKSSLGAKEELYSVHLSAVRRDFPTTSRPPLLPVAIAFVYSIAGRNTVAFAIVRICLAICLALAGALATCSTAVVMHELVTNSRARQKLSALLSSFVIVSAWGACLAFCALNQTLSSYATDFLSEPLALVLLQGLIAILIFDLRQAPGSGDSPAKRQTSLGTLVLCGVLLGLLILARSMFVLWLPFLWLLFAFLLAGHGVQRGGSKEARRFQGMQSATIICIVACLCCLPWWVRNVWVLGAFQPLGTQGTITLLGGYCDEALQHGGEWQPEPEQRLREMLSESEAWQTADSDSEREKLLSRAAQQRVRGWFTAHLPDLPRLFAARIYTHWNPYTGKSLLWKLCCLGGLGLLVWNVRQFSDPHQQTLIRNYALLFGVPLLISTFVVAVLYSVGGRFLVPCYGILFTLSGLGFGGFILLVSHFFSTPEGG